MIYPVITSYRCLLALNILEQKHLPQFHRAEEPRVASIRAFRARGHLASFEPVINGGNGCGFGPLRVGWR